MLNEMLGKVECFSELCKPSQTRVSVIVAKDQAVILTNGFVIAR